MCMTWYMLIEGPCVRSEQLLQATCIFFFYSGHSIPSFILFYRVSHKCGIMGNVEVLTRLLQKTISTIYAYATLGAFANEKEQRVCLCHGLTACSDNSLLMMLDRFLQHSPWISGGNQAKVARYKVRRSWWPFHLVLAFQSTCSSLPVLL
jgi:hypothetical protein